MILAAWYHILFSVFFAFLAILLMLVILLQRGKGVGLAGAFGGAGGNTAFGAKTGDVLTWATIGLAGVFLLAAVILNLFVFTPPTSTLGPATPPANNSTAPLPVDTDMPTPTPVQPTPRPTPPATVPASNPTPTSTPAPVAAPATTPTEQPSTPAIEETAPQTPPATSPADGNG